MNVTVSADPTGTFFCAQISGGGFLPSLLHSSVSAFPEWRTHWIDGLTQYKFDIIV
jgi:hypothetical protein